ncbi:class I SAM-dependent methyltransferase [Cupriavidus sp. CV2]|uniref:class I SAM-dependent methyltransferase n=1 Tax=Cupriavidus ulmosensis TaxID=3065913 RepID=UPI00296B2912|nr:class I SAM-dependent methyltransferase [Cupriavidus sp. CV2]MDW3689019.1 class I SAM-dependent methyltransferase [Cupriavidus sp. CV2]
MDTRQHWEQVYAGKSVLGLGWHVARLEHSLALLQRFGQEPGASLIDVGGGSSTLVDDALSMGYRVTVADVATSALNAARSRLGERSATVSWMCTDILTTDFEKKTFDIWHDRAVFHFLKAPAARTRYVAHLMRATHPGSLVIMATFSKSGPDH